jgi:hypothetical protein
MKEFRTIIYIARGYSGGTRAWRPETTGVW